MYIKFHTKLPKCFPDWQQWLAFLLEYKLYKRVPVTPHPYQHLVLSQFLTLVILIGV